MKRAISYNPRASPEHKPHTIPTPMQNRTYPKRPNGGFSLVELLIVVAVIGVIAAMSIMTLTNTDKNARTTKAKAQAQRIASTFAAGMATEAPGFKAANSVATAMNAVGVGSN